MAFCFPSITEIKPLWLMTLEMQEKKEMHRTDYLTILTKNERLQQRSRNYFKP